jgi:hypothetical protein
MEDHRYLEGMRNGILMLEEQLTKKGSKLDKQTARKAVRRLWDNFRTEFHNLGGEPLVFAERRCTGILFTPDFNGQIPGYALPYKHLFANSVSLVGRSDLLRCRAASYLHAGVANRGIAHQTHRAKQEKRTAITGGENFSVCARCSSTLSDGRCHRRRARLSRATPETPGCSRQSIEPALERAESSKGSSAWVLEAELVSPAHSFRLTQFPLSE